MRLAPCSANTIRTTDTTIWKPGYRYNRKWAWHDSILLMETTASDWRYRYIKNVSRNALRSAAVTAAEATDTTNATIWKPKKLNCRMSCVCAAGGWFHTTETTDTTETAKWKPGLLQEIELFLSRITCCICRICRIGRLCVRFSYGCICRKNFFDKTETTDTTDTTDTTILKPVFSTPNETQDIRKACRSFA